ncbi:MAG: hypothetical protein HPZ91_15605 [Lentisphaeria bacterium]|nr:hypothetical protein [Lentisphaeria bacterium]
MSELLDFCCRISGGMLWGIAFFTLLTKIILMPVSLWCQWNALVMVRLMPKINRIKLQGFGDRDYIADEEHKLFRREHYHPLLSLLPLGIQIFILLALVAAIEGCLDGRGTAFVGMVPFRDGGASWPVPLAAGGSAFLFGWTQNHLNPLQREQSGRQQLITNLISISISLVLGVFVPAGVALYWIFSNLLSILVQLACNLVLPPRKYVDYYALRRSSVLLNRLQELKRRKVSPEEKAREKRDYRRFFSIANKHLVFYSESGGFYKYYEQLIRFLLEHSNVTIHYVTSDPADRIFRIAETQPRIRPYYIGEVRLISLFMKMDADIVVMTTPDLGKFHLKRSYVRKDIEYIYIEHAISSTHLTVREGAYDHFDTFLCVCSAQMEELRRMETIYNTERKTLIPCGYGLLDTLIERFGSCHRGGGPGRNILIAPSWQPDNLLDSCLDALLEQLSGRGYRITLRPHPEYAKRFPERWNAVEKRCRERFGEDVIPERDFSSNETVFSADLVITDWSGIAYEFAFATLKPVLFINTPMKVVNRNYRRVGLEPIDITMRGEVGTALEPEELSRTAETVRALLENQAQYREKIMRVRERYVFNVGTSGAAAGGHILKSLLNRQKGKDRRER